MMPAADIIPDLYQFLILPEGNILHHLGANLGMGLDNLKFLIRQFARLVQYLLIDGYLSNVMQRRGVADHHDSGMRQAILACLPCQLLKKRLCYRADMQYMQAALPITEFNDIAQNLDHKIAVLFLFKDLFHDHALQHLLLGVQHDRILDPAPYDLAIKWTVDIIHCPQIIRVVHIGGRYFRRYHDHGDVFYPAAPVHNGQYFEAIHLRHYDIKKHKTYLIFLLLDCRYCLDSVPGLYNLILIFQHIGKDRAVHLRIVDHQYLLHLHHSRIFLIPSVIFL